MDISAENIENNELVTLETPTIKRRKKKSVVWEHFTIETVGAGCRRACCKVCKQSFAYSTGSKVAGTSHLKRHIAKGSCPMLLKNQQNQSATPFSAPSKLANGSSYTPRRRYKTTAPPYFAFDSDRVRHELARMMIIHDYSLHMVENQGFINFVQNLQPRFDMLSFNSVQGDCVATYLREKTSLQKMIESIPGRFCLTLDMWTSNLTVGYASISGYFIDNEWKLHRKMLSLVMEPYPDSDTAISHAVATCLSDWNMDGRLFSITINQSLSESANDNLRALVSIKNPLVLGGQLLIGSCLARTLSRIAHEAYTASDKIIRKVRDSVKYVKISESHEDIFHKLKQQLQVPGSKNLIIDDQMQWNRTFEMLSAASEVKEVFSCLDTVDPDYKPGPTMEEWKHVDTICTYLKFLIETAKILTSSTLQTTNMFFHEAWKIQLELTRASASEDPLIASITKPMMEKFDRYWKDCCLVLAIAVVMDPRFKMKLVEFSFSKIYAENVNDVIKIIDDGIHELYQEYVAIPLPQTPNYAAEDDNGNNNNDNESGKFDAGVSEDVLGLGGLADFDMFIMETSSQQSRSELDQYLEESLLPRVHEFDVLGWWNINKMKYPTLSRMARDILTIPVCSVHKDLVYSRVGRVMDSNQSSLRPETLEALVCAKDWLEGGVSEIYVEETTNPHLKMDFPV
ncbi:zinc finger BED domain-containing protein DAYSLEEPER-like [Impatiens glandulifera]|uniref:zinc finger BED domain-containing protein DAYSLEEPER-like n=1 Tax=Impatiens glandulifera TaxID=253017 RepID=UPI001FB1046F|nr:zinc finger BED domain-containing protein DAYSLEEPER-like [Impatiens glandulifera]